MILMFKNRNKIEIKLKCGKTDSQIEIEIEKKWKMKKWANNVDEVNLIREWFWMVKVSDID